MADKTEWVLVPRVATPEMVQASNDISCRAEGEEHWAAMLAAAPQPPSGGERGEVVVTRAGTHDGPIVAVTRQDSEGRILSVIAEAAPPSAPVGAAEDMVLDAIERRGSSAPVGVEGLAKWMIENLLTESQLSVVPPGQVKALRYLAQKPSVAPVGVDGLIEEWESDLAEDKRDGVHEAAIRIQEIHLDQLRALAQQPAPSTPVGVETLTEQFIAAFAADEAGEGSDPAAGLIGPAVSAWLRSLAPQPPAEAQARPEKPAECADGCPPQQVCDHCQWPPGPDAEAQAQGGGEVVAHGFYDPATGAYSETQRTPRWLPAVVCTAPPSAPVGWKLVPVEPTPEMRQAYHDVMEAHESATFTTSPDDQWNAMLAAAPALAQQPAVEYERHQPCGCVLCVCEDEKRCHGCGAKHCGNHTDHPALVAKQPAAVDGAMVRHGLCDCPNGRAEHAVWCAAQPGGSDNDR